MKRAILIIVLAIAAAIGGPIAAIWSLNTLFGLAIEYTFYNWLAAFFLMALLANRST